MQKLIRKLENNFKIIDNEKGKQENIWIIETEKEFLHSILDYLKNKEFFKHLALVSCVDWIENNKFQLSYILWNYKRRENIIVKVFVDRTRAEVKTIMDIFPQSEVYEREIRELYGVDFKGNPTQDEEFVLEDWEEIPPMRRDFDTLNYSLEMYGDRDKAVKQTNIRKTISDYTDEWRKK